jgi:hypothetical protein
MVVFNKREREEGEGEQQAIMVGGYVGLGLSFTLDVRPVRDSSPYFSHTHETRTCVDGCRLPEHRTPPYFWYYYTFVPLSLSIFPISFPTTNNSLLDLR